MEPHHRLLITSLAVLVVGSTVFSVGFALGRRSGDSITIRGVSGRGLSLVDEVYRTIRSAAVDPPGDQELSRGAVKGMVEALKRSNDPYAYFFSPKSYSSFSELTTGQFSGIGVWLKKKGQELEIVSVLPSTPARAAGLQRDDVIEQIDGTPVRNMTTDEAVARIKGPSGTTVSLAIDRNGDSMTFEIERKTIKLPNLRSRLQGDVGYVRLFTFARGAGNDVRDVVERMVDDGARGIILDLRDNGGGLFSEGIEVASDFIEDGKIVTYRERSGPGQVYRATGDAFESLPMVVLVNEGTASASEIVAGALQDRNRAVLIGMETYGKGSVQEVVPLPDSSAFKLTVASYYTPDGTNLSGNGIEPDVVVDASAAFQKERAMETLRGIIDSGSTALPPASPAG
ncbi:MAG TPA: S41 family peptidase [Actinomycetota bacterium]|jgi:carboxyl-terminal processing protease